MEQYKTCESAEAVSAMQEKVLADLEKSYDESRRTSGEFSSLTHRPKSESKPVLRPSCFPRISRGECAVRATAVGGMC